jgi:cyclohexanecarboxylate-CoA ligase
VTDVTNVTDSRSADSLLDRDDVHLSRERADAYRDAGLWRELHLSDYLRDAAARHPDRAALVAVDADTGRTTSIDYATYLRRSEEIADGLAGLGVTPGRTVSVMLPNVPEFAFCIFGAISLGAVYSGIPVTAGVRELGFMLRRPRSQVLVVAARDRSHDLVALVEAVAEDCPELETVVVVGPVRPMPQGGRVRWVSWEELATGTPGRPARRSGLAGGDLAHIGFTSGTTGEPKGVMNTHQTLDAVLTGWLGHVGPAIGETTVNLVASPIGHHTGFLWGVLLTARLAGTAVLLDRWLPDRALSAIADQRVTLFLGAPTFLADLVDRIPDDADLPSLRLVSIPGAPIPRGLVDRAGQRLGCFVCPAWGMTEYGIGLSAAPGLPHDRVVATDGVPVGACAVRIVDDGGAECTPGTEGHLEIHGPGLFLGYLERPDAVAESVVDGWFRTGDRAVRFDDDFVALSGRDKDVVIRGGLNIPVSEVESVLADHPSVADVSVVAVPDDRLGERACACVTVREGFPEPQLSDLVDHLLQRGVSRAYLPEFLIVFERLPRTMSGKVRKVELREWAATRLDG